MKFLADKSALARMGLPAVASILGPLIPRGLVATCAVTRLELGHSARSVEDLDQLIRDHDVLYPWVPVPDGAWDRAAKVQRELAARGTHRGVGLPDLLLAATAEAAGLVVLHYDRDFDLISAVTGQPVRWVLPAGQVP